MKVPIVGGVFAHDKEYRRSINPTPEVTLETGVRRRSVEVEVAPHSWSRSLTGIDVLHVHDLAKSAPDSSPAVPCDSTAKRPAGATGG